MWSSLQCYVLAWMGGSFGGERLHVWRPFFTIHLKLTQHCQLAITQYKLLLELKKKKKDQPSLCNSFKGHNHSMK